MFGITGRSREAFTSLVVCLLVVLLPTESPGRDAPVPERRNPSVIEDSESRLGGGFDLTVRGMPLSGLAEPAHRLAPAGRLEPRLARQPVRSMRYRRNQGLRDVLRAALIGAAVGAAVGFVYVKVGSGCWSGGSHCRRAYVRYGGSFGLVGAGVGAAVGMR